MTLQSPELWVWVSLAAATFQTVRFMLQKQMAQATLSAAGATFARFLYSGPFIVVLVGAYFAATGAPLPAIAPAFWAHAVTGGAAQIAATVCVVLLFKQRNFAVGITFKKTEVIQTALVGWVVLGEGVGGWGLAAIALGVVGLLVLSGDGARGRVALRDLTNRASALGIGSGFLFAISAVNYRGATLAVDTGDAVARAGVTLAVVVALQTLMMVLWLRWREPGEIARVWHARRVAVWIGLMSMGGSFCWFVAFALQNAAYVKAVGQAELILSIAASVLFFRERISPREILGMAVLMASILMLVLLA